MALVLTNFARIDRFFRTKRYGVDFAGLDCHNGPALALAAVTNSLCHWMPEPHSLASLAPPSRASIGSPTPHCNATRRHDGLDVLDRLAPTALTASMALFGNPSLLRICRATRASAVAPFNQLCSLVLHILRAFARDHVATPRQRLVPYWVAAPLNQHWQHTTPRRRHVRASRLFNF